MQNKKSFIPENAKSPKVRLQWYFRNIRLQKQRKRLTNANFSIISNNCLGALLTHDYLQPFLSPTVNLFINPSDFVKFISNLEDNLKEDVIEITSNKNYPVGSINGCRIDFMHYTTFKEARQQWIKRSKRVNLRNLLLLLVERDGCTYDNLKRFDSLPYPNKVAIVHKPYPLLKSTIYIPGFEQMNEVGTITDWKNLFGKRKYDIVDWVKILNNLRKE